ncbi:hypothetical protein XENORESO_003883 [Xenotaenia resolanae]|uniref:Uncharacterized protein n=1 Tax=Xenotaenia resolanae TaxID=208358 RepID=A0ABV0VX33_9TELE
MESNRKPLLLQLLGHGVGLVFRVNNNSRSSADPKQSIGLRVLQTCNEETVPVVCLLKNKRWTVCSCCMVSSLCSHVYRLNQREKDEHGPVLWSFSRSILLTDKSEPAAPKMVYVYLSWLL